MKWTRGEGANADEPAATPVKVDFPFTTRDTPEVRARIAQDVSHVARIVRQLDPRLIALALTGGFARGEGTVIDGEPVNDYDFVAIRSRPGGSALYRKIEERATRDIGLHVDVHPIASARLRRVDAKIFWYDTRQSGRVVWGDTNVLQRIPDHRPVDLPPEEALRLLANRAAGLLEVTGETGPKENGRKLHVQAAKALLAAQDARLVTSGHYHWSYRERARRYRLLEPNESRQAWTGWATVYKLEPSRALEVDPNDLWDAARRLLIEEYGRTLRLMGYRHPVEYAANAGSHAVERAYYMAQVLGMRRKGKRGMLNPLVARPSARVSALGLVLLLSAGAEGANSLGLREASKLFRGFGRVPRDYEDMVLRLFELRGVALL